MTCLWLKRVSGGAHPRVDGAQQPVSLELGVWVENPRHGGECLVPWWLCCRLHVEVDDPEFTHDNGSPELRAVAMEAVECSCPGRS